MLIDMLARYARQIVMLDAALLLVGVLLTSLNLLLIGWSVYICGHVLLIVALPAIGAYFRSRMDGWSWAALLVAELGLILALPQLATIWSSYLQTPTAAVMQVPSQTEPMGRFAELVMWLGLAAYGLAARGARALPAVVGWIFVVAAILGLLAAFVTWWIITPLWWVLAMLTLVVALVGVGGSLVSSPVPAQKLSPATPESGL